MADFILSAFADEAAASLDGQIAALLRNGLRHIEPRNVDGRYIGDYTAAELSEMRKKLDDAGVSLSAVGSPIGKIGIGDLFEPHCELAKRTAQAAQILGTKRLRVFSFFMPSGEDPARYKDTVLERLNTLCDIADAEGCVCYHENEKDIFGDTAARVLQIHEAVGPRLHGVFDPANYIQCSETPVDIWPQIKPHIDYLHIKDALLEDGSVVPAGCGDGGIASLLEDFREPDAGRLLTIEPHLAVFEGLSNLQSHGVKHKYAYPSNDAAFDAACSALKEILKERGYSYE